MENGAWTQIRATVKTEELDTLCAVMGMLDNGLMIEDYSDVEQELDGVYGDLIDESVLNADRSIASVSIYVPADKPLGDYQLFLEERLRALGVDAEVTYTPLSEEDWADSWKQYYKPIHIGNRLVIVPAWEKYDCAPHEIEVTMDPGMAFGTGTHETTRLVAEMLEEYVTEGCRLLDVGCGSGILAICGAKLGAGLCRAYDIDPVAVRVANENTRENNVDAVVTCAVSDLLRDVDLSDGGYDVVTANIVADIIIRMAPDVRRCMAAGAVLIVSGIIDERADEVRTVLLREGFTIDRELHENGWTAIAVR